MKYSLIIVSAIIAFGMSWPHINDYIVTKRFIEKDKQKMLAILTAVKSYNWDAKTLSNQADVLDEIFQNRNWGTSAGCGCQECNPGPHFRVVNVSDYKDFNIETVDDIGYPIHKKVTLHYSGEFTVRGCLVFMKSTLDESIQPLIC
jgi:hypothetical protein